jgi:hypothetical protein
MQGFGRKAVKVATVLACLALVGCVGPTQTLQQGKDLCACGVQYTEALDKLLDVTIETVIDYDSDELIRQRKYADPNDLRGFLDERDEAMIEQVRTLETFRGQGRRLRAYFVGLQELVDANVRDSAAAAVGDLSNSIATANESLRKSQKLDFDEEEQAAISQFGGLAARGVHARAVKNVLCRDAAVIAEQLALHEKLLEKLHGILEDRYAGQRDVVHNQKIRRPYVAADESLGEEWKADRKEWIRSSFCLEELTQATEAVHQMRFVWAGILEGRRSVESVRLALNDIQEFTQAVQALHEAGKEQED